MNYNVNESNISTLLIAWNNFAYPLQIRIVTVLNGQRYNLTNCVRVILFYILRELIDFGRSRLDHHQHFGVFVYFTFPFVNGCYFRYDIDTCCQFFADQSVADFLGHFFAGGRYVRHGMFPWGVTRFVCRAYLAGHVFGSHSRELTRKPKRKYIK